MNVLEKYLAYHELPGLGTTRLRAIVDVPFWADLDWPDLLAQIPILGRVQWSPEVWKTARNSAKTTLDIARANDAQILTLADPTYPALLRNTSDAPALLYVKGNLKPTLERPLAVIGTREPTVHGAIVAKRIATHFALQGWSIVSGLAIGVDAIAHQSALEAGGHTVAVLAHGLQTIAPKQHRDLAAQILEAGGALITEYPFGVEPRGHQYVQRDRIQAGLARATILIQSDLTGGSMHASRASLRYGRWLAFPVPSARDQQERAMKIQAPMVLLGGSPTEQMELLKCDSSALQYIISLHSKQDYATLERYLGERKENEADQPALF